MRVLLSVCAFLGLISCGDPAPTCAPHGTSYTVCSSKKVYECPNGDSAVVQYNQDLDAACAKETDPTACILKAKYKQVDMVLKADCVGGGETCVESVNSGSVKSAACQKP